MIELDGKLLLGRKVAIKRANEVRASLRMDMLLKLTPSSYRLHLNTVARAAQQERGETMLKSIQRCLSSKGMESRRGESKYAITQLHSHSHNSEQR